MLTTLPNPTIFAHRGSSAHAPENTIAAFELAVRQAADAIELDARLSADQEVVVFHDQTVDRTTNGTGRLGDLPLAALRQLDAGSYFDVAYRGEPIPTLSEVLEAVGQRIFINIELKNYDTPNDALPEKVAQLVLQHGLSDRVLFSSFHPFVVRRIHRLLPEVPIGLLIPPGFVGKLVGGWPGKLIVAYQALHPRLTDVTESLVRRAHQAGKRVNVFTITQPADMRFLFSLAVDGIFTPDPLLARQVLASFVGAQPPSGK